MHIAFTNHVNLLRKNNISVKINSFGGADITHIHSLGLFALYKLLTSKRTVVSSHTLPATMVGTFKGSQYWGGIFKKYLTFFYNRADLILPFSSLIEEELKKLGVTKNMAIVANPVDTHFFKQDKQLRKKVRKRFGIKEDEFVILGAGQLIQRKGIKDFIAVAKELPFYKFVWVGGNSASLIHAGIEKSFLKKKLPKNLSLLGNFPYEEMPELFNIADILFFPSYQETQGLVIIEAAACGLPLILRDLTEYRYLYNKSYYACQTNAQFVEIIKKLKSDKKEYNKAQDLSLSLAKDFSIEEVGSKLLSYYNSLYS